MSVRTRHVMLKYARFQHMNFTKKKVFPNYQTILGKTNINLDKDTQIFALLQRQFSMIKLTVLSYFNSKNYERNLSPTFC